MYIPHIKGTVYEDEHTLGRYSTDMSGYTLQPSIVALPSDEEDVLCLFEYAKNKAFPITPRGAGSNLSGSAVGSGLVLHFKNMAKVIGVKERLTVLEPGVVYRNLNEKMASRRLTLRYDVSSGGFSTIGGNIATKAGGLRSIKYGNADESVRHLRFVCPAFGVVDTSKNLATSLEQDIVSLRKKLMDDEDARLKLLDRRGLKSSSGYNLQALVDYENPADMVSHLMSGSVGTLGIITQLTLKLVPIPAHRRFYIAFFTDLLEAIEAAPALVDMKPSALEAMDSLGTSLVREEGGITVPAHANTTVLIELDDFEEGQEDALCSLLSRTSIDFTEIEDQSMIDKVWKIRWTMLTQLKRMHEDAEHRYLSFVDDMAVPLNHLYSFIDDIQKIFSEERLDAVIFGHIGEGNLHIRPLIGKKHWKEVVRRVGKRCFETVLSYGGTLTAEHGTGRNRAPYLSHEWGKKLYPYLSAVKKIFDPGNLLNPDVMFTSHDITHDLRF